MKIVLKVLKPLEWSLVLIAIGFIVLGVWLDIEMPKYIGEITTLLNKNIADMNQIWVNGGIMLGLTIGSVATTVVVAIIVARIAATVSTRLRSSIFNKVQSFSMEEIGKFSIPSLVTRTTNDIEQIQIVIIFGLQSIIKSPILIIWSILEISGSGSWQWTASVGIAIALLITIMIFFVLIVLPKFNVIQKQTDDLNRVSRERLSGIRVIRAYNAESYQDKKFEVANTNLTKTNLFTSKKMAFLWPCVDLVINGLSLAIYWIGAILIASAPDTSIDLARATLFADMIVFSQYALQILMAILMMVMIFMFLPRAIVANRRIKEVLNTNTKIKDGHLTAKDSTVHGQLIFKNVKFKYPDAEDYVLEDINFQVEKGQTLAFIGSTGSGKTTIANLIPRFFDVTDGEIIVNGHNIKDYKKEELNKLIGYVSQKPKLFSGTIKSNITIGEDEAHKLSDSQIAKAIEIAQAKEFVANSDKHLERRVSQDGTNFSGGQKQRLSIARALARDPDFLIFDDSFSALDYRTDRLLRAAIHKQIKHSTIIIIAQRIGTIMNADKIVVLEDGKIAGIGTHQQLLKNNAVYKEIAYSQLSKQELANE